MSSKASAASEGSGFGVLGLELGFRLLRIWSLGLKVEGLGFKAFYDDLRYLSQQQVTKEERHLLKSAAR